MISEHLKKREKIYIFDTTLRDGAQTEGVNFSVDDKNKARAYEEYAQVTMKDFRDMVQAKKVEINIASFSGYVTSNYSGTF